MHFDTRDSWLEDRMPEMQRCHPVRRRQRREGARLLCALWRGVFSSGVRGGAGADGAAPGRGDGAHAGR